MLKNDVDGEEVGEGQEIGESSSVGSDLRKTGTVRRGRFGVRGYGTTDLVGGTGSQSPEEITHEASQTSEEVMSFDVSADIVTDGRTGPHEGEQRASMRRQMGVVGLAFLIDEEVGKVVGEVGDVDRGREGGQDLGRVDGEEPLLRLSAKDVSLAEGQRKLSNREELTWAERITTGMVASPWT